MKIKLSITPTSGDSFSTEVDVPATGTSVKDVLKAAGKKANGMQISVNGKAADETTHVGPKGKVTLTEKVRGS